MTTSDLLAALSSLAGLPSELVACVPIVLFVCACVLCMVPSLVARVRSSR